MIPFYRFFFSLVFCASLWLGGFVWFGLQVPTISSLNPKGDAIIVLTGGAGRVKYGLDLLANNNGKAVFISGVSKKVRMGDVLRQASPKTRRAIKKMKPTPVYLGARAQNTIGNAEEVKEWLRDKDYQKLLLVTSAYHMPRSLSELTAAMPNKEWVAAPVLGENAGSGNWLFDRETRRIFLIEYHKFMASKLRHWFVQVTKTS